MPYNRIRARRVLALLLAVVVVVYIMSVPGLPGAARAAEPDQGWVPDKSDPGWQRFAQVMGILRELYVDPPDMSKIWSGAVRGAVEALGDRYSTYLEPRQYQQFQEEVLQGTFGGVGVVLDLLGSYPTVVSTLPGTPAEKAGLQPGDRIVEVDGEKVVGWLTEAVAQKIRGQPGSRVTLLIERGASAASLKVELVREEIKVHPLEVKLLDGQVAYLRLSSFELGVGHTFSTVMAVYRSRGIDKYILDLRGNPGGLLNEAAVVANQFLPPGPLVKVVQQGGKTATLESAGRRWDYSLVVLVDGGTASAAEIVAGALKDRGFGFLVGTCTFGKGSVQSVIPFGDGAALKITIARFLTPLGYAINGKGVEPNLVVEPGPARTTRVEPFAWKRDLRRGVVGLDVLSLQENLAFLGYYRGGADGIYGRGTEAAVRQLQSAQGLAATGAVDTRTAGTLAERVRQQLITGKPADPVLEKALGILTGSS